METAEEKLQAIKDKARREAAERAQASAAASRATARQERRNPEKYRFTAGHLVMAMVAIIGLGWIYMSKEPEKPDTFKQDLERAAASMVEYKDDAFKWAAFQELAGRGLNTSDISQFDGGRLSGDIYVATFTLGGQAYRLRGEYICDSGISPTPANAKDPACYRWH